MTLAVTTEVKMIRGELGVREEERRAISMGARRVTFKGD